MAEDLQKGNSANKRLLKNTMYLYFQMFLMLAINLYTGRIVLQVLGIVDYGIYNVVGTAITFLNFVVGSLSVASSRFITYSLSKNGNSELKSLFGNILMVYLLLAAVIILVGETIGLWMLYKYLVIPPDRFVAACWVYHISIISTILGVLCTPYISVLIAYENMSAFAFLAIIDAVLKLLVVFVVQYTTFDKLIAYSILILSVSVIDRIMYSLYCGRHYKETITFPKINMDVFKSLFSFAGWVSIGALAYSCYTIGLNIVLNMFYGPVVNAARGIAVQVQNVVNDFCIKTQTAINPQITKSYASNDQVRLRSLLFNGSKYSYYLLLIISMPIMFEIKQFLDWWLVEVPEWTEIFSILMIADIIIRVLAYSVVQAVQAVGDIKKFQVIEGGIQLMILPVSYIILYCMSCPPYIPFIIILVFEPLIQYARIAIVLPKLGIQINDYVKEVVAPIVYVSVLSPVIPFAMKLLLPQDSLPSFFAVCFFAVLSTVLISFFIGCSKSERRFLLEKTRNKVLDFCK